MLLISTLVALNLAGVEPQVAEIRQPRLGLEEVVVTAQKQAENLQQVPIAVTAFSAEAITEAGISNVSGVAARTPGFSMGTFNPTQPQLYIRGIGSNSDGAGGGEQSVAMFVDGVYFNRSALTGVEFFDLQSIEVLRGPQGTLWGKNAIAGAINITTEKPTEKPEVEVQLSAGDIGYARLRAMVNGALAENLNGKISFNKKDRDGYVKSVVNSNISTGNEDSGSLRAQLLHTPTAAIESLLILDYGRDQRSGGAAVPSDEQGLLGVYLRDPAVPKAGFYENYMEEPGQTEMTSKGVSLQIDAETTFGSITSITGYRDSKASFNNIIFGAGLSTFPVLFLDNFARENSSIVSQELRLSGEITRWQWQTGVYINSEDTQRLEGFDLATAIDLDALFSGVGVIPIGMDLQLPTDSADQHNKTKSAAVFGQTTYAVNQNLDLIFGVRYTHERKKFSNVGARGTGIFVQENYDVSASERWSSPTYRLVANYQIDENISAYASAATGFKSGGFDGVASNAEVASTPFDEEAALNVELGMKAMLLGDTLRLNTAVFHTDYDDLQILQTFPNGNPIPPLQTKNAGEAVSQGAELEVVWAATSQLYFSAHYAYLDARYTKLDGQLAIYEGGKLRNAPRNAYGLVANYETAIVIGGEIRVRVEYLYKDEAFQDVQNRHASAIPSYELVNFRLAYGAEGGNWEIAAWVNNVLQEEYYAHNYGFMPFGTLSVPALPRHFGADLTLRF